jgi:metal-responsive CopG/Arc/MetJ family transcriptional regulator
MLKMTFSIPDEIAGPFLREVPAARRSEVVTEALRKTLAMKKMKRMQDAEMIAACDALNADPDIAELERDMDALSGDGLDEYPWDSTASR